MRSRNPPATSVPMSPRVCAVVESPSWMTPATDSTPTASSTLATRTTVEWPRENQNPVPTADRPSPTSLRVVLSMVAMWSASKACRTPSR